MFFFLLTFLFVSTLYYFYYFELISKLNNFSSSIIVVDLSRIFAVYIFYSSSEFFEIHLISNLQESFDKMVKNYFQIYLNDLLSKSSDYSSILFLILKPQYFRSQTLLIILRNFDYYLAIIYYSAYPLIKLMKRTRTSREIKISSKIHYSFHFNSNFFFSLENSFSFRFLVSKSLCINFTLCRA